MERVNEAVRHFDEGTYGYCVDCGEVIASSRLRAMPFAIRCKECEEMREHTQHRERVQLQRVSSGLGSRYRCVKRRRQQAGTDIRQPSLGKILLIGAVEGCATSRDRFSSDATTETHDVKFLRQLRTSVTTSGGGALRKMLARSAVQSIRRCRRYHRLIDLTPRRLVSCVRGEQHETTRTTDAPR